MRTDPSDPTNPPEPVRLQREAVLVVQDRGRVALLIGLCTLAGVAAGFAMASVAYGDRREHACAAVAPAAAPAPPVTAPAPVVPVPNPGHGHGHGRGGGRGMHLHGPGWHLWSDPFNSWAAPVPRAWLGVITETDPAGARITSVAPGSPATAAGLAAGDIITEVDGEQIATPSQLSGTIGGLDPGKKVKVQLLRGGKAMTLEATLAERP